LYRCSGDLLDRTCHPWTFVNVIFLHSDVCIFFRCGVCVFYGNIIRFSLVQKNSIIDYNKTKKILYLCPQSGHLLPLQWLNLGTVFLQPLNVFQKHWSFSVMWLDHLCILEKNNTVFMTCINQYYR
jgi:hypothetical protein